MSLMKKVIKETQNVDFETGEIRSSEKVLLLPKEPAYVKLYIDDIAKLYSLPKGSSDLMLMLVRKMGYDGLISITAGYKEVMSRELGMKTQSINNSIQKLIKEGILKRVARGEYMMDPSLFAKGEWSDIRRLRDKYLEVNVTYTSSGKRKISSHIKENPKARQLDIEDM